MNVANVRRRPSILSENVFPPDLGLSLPQVEEYNIKMDKQIKAFFPAKQVQTVSVRNSKFVKMSEFPFSHLTMKYGL